MSVRAANTQYTNLVSSIGKGALSAIFPKDFEAYIMAIELTDSLNNTIDYFAFPILPESITKSEPKRTNIKKSSSGVTVLTSNSYVPEEISIKGNFGRSFKFTLLPSLPSIAGFAFSTGSGKYDLLSTKSPAAGITPATFMVGIKSGYGAHSMLRAIINKSNGVDATGKPFRLYFYNMAMGESYIVTVPPQGFVSSQNREKNMIWDYSLTLQTIAPLSALLASRKKGSLLKLLAFNAIQKSVNVVANDVSNQL